MKKLGLFLLVVLGLSSCDKEKFYPPTCPTGCDAKYKVIYAGEDIGINVDGFYEIEWKGLNYFQIEGVMSELDPHYVINKVPLIEVNFDSDYWILIDSIRFSTPMYSYLGWFNGSGFNTPISIENHVYTMEQLSKNHTPLNVAGYQIQKYFCWECLYAHTLLGSHSKYNYRPKQNILLDNEMIGDTINVFTEAIFNNDLGRSETINNIFKVVIK
jgi:hypothetical protein